LLPQTPGIDVHALRDYLTFLYVPSPRSIFLGIRQLPPGHLLIIEEDREPVLSKYWRLPPVEPERPRAEVVEALRNLLVETVDEHLVADVPLGAFLSGGLDSTTLVAMMARKGTGRVKTFCMTFEPDAGLYDEREYARAVAHTYGTEHTEIPVHPDLVDLLPQCVEHFGEPFGNPTSLLVYLLSRETRRHVTVALAGDGGDELFLGYPRYQGAALSRAYRHAPAAARGLMAERIAPLIPESTRGFHALRRIREFLIGTELPEDAMYAQWVTYFTAREQHALLEPEIRRATAGDDPLSLLSRTSAADQPRDLVDRCQALDLTTFLPGNLLTYSDRMSMAHALEVRTPFCDHRLVEFMARLPAHQKMPRLRTKDLLRRAVSDLLPPSVKRRRKLGFNPPVGIWLNGPLRPMLEETLSPARLKADGIFQAGAVERLQAEHQSGQRDRSLHLYALLNFQVWSQRFRASIGRQVGGVASHEGAARTTTA
jgi:asparagine synthase (glutamine-hydrolysing)